MVLNKGKHSVCLLFLLHFLTTCMSLSHEQLHSPKPVAQGVDLRILPLGDSITFGEGSTEGNGYRLALSKLLTKHGIKLNYIGSVQSGTMADNHHEGHGGHQIIAVGLEGKPDYALRPNVVLLMAGINDIVFNTDIAKAPNRLAELARNITAACPDAAVLVATLTPLLNPGWSNKVDHFNDALLNVIADLAEKGKKVTLVDMSRVNTSHVDPIGGIHPTDDGYETIAAAWYDGILATSEKGWIEKPLPGASQNRSEQLSEQEMEILEKQPDTPTLEDQPAPSTWTLFRLSLYLALLLILIVSARKVAGIVFRRY